MNFSQCDVAEVVGLVHLLNDSIDPLTVEAWLERRGEDAQTYVDTNKLFASEGGHVSVATMFMQAEQADELSRHSKARAPEKKRVRIKKKKKSKPSFKGAPILHGVWLYHGQPKDNRANVTLH